MSLFDSRNTPLVGAPGFETTALPSLTVLLSTLVAIPDSANAATLQGIGNTVFGYRLDGGEGADPGQCMWCNELYLSNREQLANVVVVAVIDGAVDLAVQFYTGRTGPAYR